MVIHLTDMLVLEDDFVASRVSAFQRDTMRKRATVDNTDRGAQRTFGKCRDDVWKLSTGRVFPQTTDLVTRSVVKLGKVITEHAQKRFTSGPNGKHFVETVLFSCLLPTVGFHVLSRTGHTDLIDAFWKRHNAILHSSGHLKYQELSIFYGFFRGILPTIVVDELFSKKPGRSVMKLLSFTGFGRQAIDRRGWTYVHRDEALEMLIVRHLKSLSVNFLSHLENSAAWLMEVSMFRAMLRYVTGASRCFGHRWLNEDGGEVAGPLSEYDRTACQWRTVARMLHMMREKGFLTIAHRGSEWVMNVFCTPAVRMNIQRDQELLLDIVKRGELTSKFHTSVLFPNVFGPLTEEDKSKHFAGARFKKWTKARAVPRPAQSMSKENGSVSVNENGSSVVRTQPVMAAVTGMKRPSTKGAFARVIHERRRKLSEAKDALYQEERKAIRLNNKDYLSEVMSNWDTVHNARHKIPPFADCFLDQHGNLNHGIKSRFLKYSKRNNRDIVYTLNMLPTTAASERPVSQNIFEASIDPYFSIQFDVMNALHYRGDTGERGTVLADVVCGKMKSVLRQWLKASSARELRQVHLHIDDPNLVVSQKLSEQIRRDMNRQRSTAKQGGDEDTAWKAPKLDFQDHLTLPWGSLISDRAYKDELASLHLFCAAIAAFELLSEYPHSCAVFLHGGSFAVPTSFTKSRPSDFKPRRYREGMDELFKGSVILRKGTEGGLEDGDLFLVPRSKCLVFETTGVAYVGQHDLRHGESETRFVAAFKSYPRRIMRFEKSAKRMHVASELCLFALFLISYDTNFRHFDLRKNTNITSKSFCTLFALFPAEIEMQKECNKSANRKFQNC